VAGIGVIGVERCWPMEEILARFRMSDEDAARLHAYFPNVTVTQLAPPAHPAPRVPLHGHEAAARPHSPLLVARTAVALAPVPRMPGPLNLQVAISQAGLRGGSNRQAIPSKGGNTSAKPRITASSAAFAGAIGPQRSSANLGTASAQAPWPGPLDVLDVLDVLAYGLDNVEPVCVRCR
jgi:hypothetical protein